VCDTVYVFTTLRSTAVLDLHTCERVDLTPRGYHYVGLASDPEVICVTPTVYNGPDMTRITHYDTIL
jgi:hypothetical protein